MVPGSGTVVNVSLPGLDVVAGFPLAHEASAALKLSAAFGGANAALVLRRDAAAPGRAARDAREVFVSRAVAIVDDVVGASDPHELAATTGYSEDRLARADALVRLTIGAAVRLRELIVAAGQGTLEGAGIIVGHGLATIDTNATYLARIRAHGASRGEPRRFPYTTPNAPAGECAVALGLTGPAFAVGGGPHGGLEALAVAADLVRGGIADRIVVVAVDEAGEGSRRVAPASRPGAVALLVSADSLSARLESWSVRLPARLGVGDALVSAPAVEALDARTPWGGFANVSLFWL